VFVEHDEDELQGVTGLRVAPGIVVAATAAVLCSLAAGGCRDRAAPYVCRDCNVLLISMDTLRADHVGAYGHARPTTPNIDRIAERGVLFSNAISQSSWTRPAHMSMFTGMYPAEHGYLALVDRKRLSKTVPTLASVMAEHGYTTVAFTGGVNMSASFGFDRGFDLYRVNGRYYRDSLEEVKYWLDGVNDKKFLLLMHGYDPHTPYRCDTIDRQALSLPRPPSGKGFRHACRREKAKRILRFVDEYDGGIRKGDRYIGKLLAYMEELGLLDNTLIVFTSDHGEEFLEHGRCFHLTTLYREVLHVPLIIAGPGIKPRTVAELVPASVSVAPTILDLVGIADHPLPGPSLAAALEGKTPHFDYVQSETFRRTEGGRGEGHVRALTGSSEKLVEWVEEEKYAYFDLTVDGTEKSPVTAGGDVDRMKALMDTWTAAHPLMVEHDAIDDAEDRHLERELKSLGYME
jgi:arylsulfatase A-like enzyme